MSDKETKTQYRIRNWSKYNEALKQRGSLTFWVDEEVLAGWLNGEKTGKRGASPTYSDLAVRQHSLRETATMSTMGSLFNLAGRQTQGLMESLFELMGVELSVPDYSTLVEKTGKIKHQFAHHLRTRCATCGGGFDGYQSLWRRRMESTSTWVQ